MIIQTTRAKKTPAKVYYTTNNKDGVDLIFFNIYLIDPFHTVENDRLKQQQKRLPWWIWENQLKIDCFNQNRLGWNNQY